MLGVPFAKTGPTTTGLFGPFPVGYAKLVKGNFNIEIGALPTLVGDEYTFTFENMNIERGLLWNQEQAVSRGIQLNDTYKKLTLAFSWNDNFYSDRYTSLSGSLAYAINAANTITFVGAGNAGNTYVRIGPANSFPVTPAYQNNEQVYNLIYTYTKGSLDHQSVLPVHGRKIGSRIQCLRDSVPPARTPTAGRSWSITRSSTGSRWPCGRSTSSRAEAWRRTKRTCWGTVPEPARSHSP